MYGQYLYVEDSCGDEVASDISRHIEFLSKFYLAAEHDKSIAQLAAFDREISRKLFN